MFINCLSIAIIQSRFIKEINDIAKENVNFGFDRTMNLIRIILIAFVLGIAITASADVNNDYRPPGMSENAFTVLKAASNFMDQSRYDSAQYLITDELSQTSVSLNEIDLYYLHAYESEIMYYNALFEQGLNSAVRALSIASALQNDTLIGSAENLIGLFYMNLDKEKDAIKHFQNAIKLLPPGHNNSFLAFQYHAYANLGECYLRINEPDSTIVYASASIAEAEMRGRTRGVALARWALAEAFLSKNEIAECIVTVQGALELVKNTVHRDVIQTLDCTMMKCYQKKNLPDSAYHWMKSGLEEMDHPLNTDFSRKEFLQSAIKLCIQQNNLSEGSRLLEQLNQLNSEVSTKEQNQRVNILKDYYEKNQKLVVEKQVNEVQKKELGLRKIIEWVLILLAALSILLIIILYRIFRQKQKIAELNHSRSFATMKQDLELKSLKGRMEALFDERNRIASDLHDDIGAALSSIRIYSSAAQKQMASNPDEGMNLIAKINESSTSMMERMSDIVWSINPKNDSGESLILRMKTFASEVLGSMHVDLVYNIDNTIENIKPTLEARKNVYLIFKEAINNIAKYSEASKVEISLSINDGFFEMNIKDNGKGFNVTQAFKGNGLTNMSQRAKAMDAYFHVTSHANSGTLIQLKMEYTTISDIEIQSI